MIDNDNDYDDDNDCNKIFDFYPDLDYWCTLANKCDLKTQPEKSSEFPVIVLPLWGYSWAIWSIPHLLFTYSLPRKIISVNDINRVS